MRRAELAGQRGQWREALGALEDARAAGFGDELELDLRRAGALVALSRREEANELLARLEIRPDIGAHLGRVLLYEGELALSEWEEQERALELVRRALQSEGLSQADREFAAGLLDETVDGALAAFARARAHDPFHHGALDAALMLTAMTGDHEQALVQAHAFEALYCAATRKVPEGSRCKRGSSATSKLLRSIPFSS